MSRPVDTRAPHYAASSKRVRKSVAITAHNTTTGTLTLASSSFLNDMAPNDVVDLSGLVGGECLHGVGVLPGPPTLERWHCNLSALRFAGRADNHRWLSYHERLAQHRPAH